MTTRWFEIYAPLQEFSWNGDSLELCRGLWIQRFGQKPDLRGLAATLGEDERDNVCYAQHWLTFRWDEGSDPSPAETVNLVLLALWLVKRTKTYVAFRFQLGQGAAAAEQCRRRLLDRFDWVPGATHEEFGDSDLQSASSHFRVLHSLCCARGRLNNALLLTLAGCWSHRWQVALICHAVAAEALLTYATGPRITRRLATSYACLVERQQLRRDAAFREFHNLYTVRSDIMHGRTHNVSPNDRLPTLARFGDVLRRLWQIVISSQPLITALEGTDAERKAYFLSVQSAYTAPP
jgi:hypothetical protein